MYSGKDITGSSAVRFELLTNALPQLHCRLELVRADVAVAVGAISGVRPRLAALVGT